MRRPPSGRGAMVREPSCTVTMLLTIARPSPTPAWPSRVRSRAALERLGERRDQLAGADLAGVLDGEHHASRAATRCATRHGAALGQVVDDGVVHEVRRHLQQERRRPEGRGDLAGGVDGDPALLGEREQRLGGLLDEQRQVDGLPGERPRSARLSTSSASVRSIARALTAWRRSTSSSGSWVGSLRATSRRVCEIASGVRSSCEALAANRCCSATWASSRASMASKASASSRNSSLRPSSRIRWDSDPLRGQAGGVGDAGQRGEHPAGEAATRPPGRTPAGRPARSPRRGANARRRSVRLRAPGHPRCRPRRRARGAEDRERSRVLASEPRHHEQHARPRP